jgi:hypothetical protein
VNPSSDDRPAPGRHRRNTSPTTPTVTFWAATLRVLVLGRLLHGESTGTTGVKARS